MIASNDQLEVTANAQEDASLPGDVVSEARLAASASTSGDATTDAPPSSDSLVPSSAPRFFWALASAPVISSRRSHRPLASAQVLPAGLVADLAEQVPIDASLLHAVVVPLAVGGEGADLGETSSSSASHLICAVESTRLAAYQQSHPEASHLAPTHIPELLTLVEPRVSRINPESFNMLVGAFEPLARTQTRRRLHALAACTLLVCSALLALGLLRRASAWERQSQVTRASTQQLLSSLPESPMHRDRPGQPRSTDLAGFWASRNAAARTLIAQAGLVVQHEQPFHDDAVATLDTLLEHWPTEHAINLKPLNLNATASSVSMSLLFESNADPAPFLAALGQADQPRVVWRMPEPRLTRPDPSTTRVQLSITIPAQERDSVVNAPSTTSRAERRPTP